jgi:Domain of unknown function (DUF5666)
MKPALLVLTLGSVAVFAEERHVIGAIEKLTRGEMIVKMPRASLTIYADDRTEAIKGQTYRGLSPLKVGDEISVHCELNGSGKLVAVRIWASVVSFSATVKYVNRDDIEVIARFNSDSPREERKIVRLYPDTAFSAPRKDLKEGRDLWIVGLDVGNGTVDAVRVALYNTDMPATK